MPIDHGSNEERRLELRRAVVLIGVVAEGLNRDLRVRGVVRRDSDGFDCELHCGDQRRLAGAVGPKEAGIDQ